MKKKAMKRTVTDHLYNIILEMISKIPTFAKGREQIVKFVYSRSKERGGLKIPVIAEILYNELSSVGDDIRDTVIATIIYLMRCDSEKMYKAYGKYETDTEVMCNICNGVHSKLSDDYETVHGTLVELTTSLLVRDSEDYIINRPSDWDVFTAVLLRGDISLMYRTFIETSGDMVNMYSAMIHHLYDAANIVPEELGNRLDVFHLFHNNYLSTLVLGFQEQVPTLKKLLTLRILDEHNRSMIISIKNMKIMRVYERCVQYQSEIINALMSQLGDAETKEAYSLRLVATDGIIAIEQYNANPKMAETYDISCDVMKYTIDNNYYHPLTVKHALELLSQIGEIDKQPYAYYDRFTGYLLNNDIESLHKAMDEDKLPIQSYAYIHNTIIDRIFDGYPNPCGYGVNYPLSLSPKATLYQILEDTRNDKVKILIHMELMYRHKLNQ